MYSIDYSAFVISVRGRWGGGRGEDGGRERFVELAPASITHQ